MTCHIEVLRDAIDQLFHKLCLIHRGISFPLLNLKYQNTPVQVLT